MRDKMMFMPLNGFTWIEVTGPIYELYGEESKEKAPFLVEYTDEDNIISPITGYDPMNDKPTLFLEFSEIKPTKESILEFANKYGALREEHYIEAEGIIHGDSLNTWKKYIREMNDFVNKWLELNKKKRDIEDNAKLGDLVQQVNMNMIKAKLGLTILQKEYENGYETCIVPRNLYSAVWLQCFYWVAGDKEYKKCACCYNWEDTTGLRSDWREHRECGAKRRAKESYERRKN